VALSQPKRISDIKPLFGNLALNSQYQVIFGGLSKELQLYLGIRGVDPRFISENVGLLCHRASLPGSSVAVSDVVGNYTGVSERFAHARVFTDIQLDFYVDKEYKTLKFLEHWVEYISSASGVDPANPGYFYRMRYPTSYKSNSTKIVKFNRDFKSELQYNFIGLFPKDLISASVSYDDSQPLVASCSFSYERYICGPVNSIDILKQIDNNKQPVSQTAPTINNVGPSAPTQTVTTTPTRNQITNSTVNRTITPLTGSSSGNQTNVTLVSYIPGTVTPTTVLPR
jgi:hypothetical protein